MFCLKVPGDLNLCAEELIVSTQKLNNLASEILSLDMRSSPPTRNTLSLNALRAFEAAARLGSFTQAATELSVTSGAVAAQIKSMEREFGAALFERNAKGVQLTKLGESASENFTQAFNALEEAARDLRQRAAPNKVHIVTSPALAQLWLHPRLRRMAEIAGPVDISVTVLDDPPNLKRSPFDICLFYLDKVEAYQTRLYEEHVFPVCTPELARLLCEPSDLLRAKCIPDVVWKDWSIWSQAKLPGERLIPNGPSFSLYSIAVRQALLGTGVLIGRRSLVDEHLQSGALVAPFEDAVPLGLTISAWTLPQSQKNRVVDRVFKSLGEVTQSIE